MFEITRNITSLPEVKSFALYLYNDVKLTFHPDESFLDYVTTDTGQFAFSESEAQILNLRMGECLNVCEKEGFDIYEYLMQFSPLKFYNES